MSLAAIRDEFRVPARPGAPVTVQVSDFAPAYEATITGSKGDWILVQANDDHRVHMVTVQDLTFH